MVSRHCAVRIDGTVPDLFEPVGLLGGALTTTGGEVGMAQYPSQHHRLPGELVAKGVDLRHESSVAEKTLLAQQAVLCQRDPMTGRRRYPPMR